MSKAQKLLEKDFIKTYLEENVLPLYPEFSEIKDIEIHAYKDHIWKGGTYHLVIEYKTQFLNKEGASKTLPIFCTAHSSEPRENVYRSLKFLWDHGFSEGDLTIPRPLFFSEEFRGTFYRGVEGQNLYHYIRENDFEEIENILPKTAKWFAILHDIATDKAENFNEINSRIETVYPGIEHVLESIRHKYPSYHNIYKEIYAILNDAEKEFLASTDQRWLAHGDAHPENIIRLSADSIAVIDFTDLCLTDFARDIGSFLQQLEFMANRKIADKDYVQKIMKLFLDEYLSARNITIDADLQRRIDTYYYWTTMRTATHFLIKDNPESERAYPMIAKVADDIKKLLK